MTTLLELGFTDIQTVTTAKASMAVLHAAKTPGEVEGLLLGTKGKLEDYVVFASHRLSGLRERAASSVGEGAQVTLADLDLRWGDTLHFTPSERSTHGKQAENLLVLICTKADEAALRISENYPVDFLIRDLNNAFKHKGDIYVSRILEMSNNATSTTLPDALIMIYHAVEPFTQLRLRLIQNSGNDVEPQLLVYLEDTGFGRHEAKALKLGEERAYSQIAEGKHILLTRADADWFVRLAPGVQGKVYVDEQPLRQGKSMALQSHMKLSFGHNIRRPVLQFEVEIAQIDSPVGGKP